MFLPRNHHLQMSSCLAGADGGGGGGGGGGGRAYAFELEILKSPSTSSSPSSTSTTLSESSNSGLTITTRKPRTPRKRPNQTYNEAAALLSTAYPNLFSPKHLASAANSRTFSKSPFISLSDDSSELFFPFRIFDVDDSTFLIDQKPSGGARAKFERKFSFSTSSSTTSSEKSSCLSPGEFDSSRTTTTASFCPASSMDCEEEENGDFDYAESILDEEADDGGGIDNIMGNLTVESSSDSPPMLATNGNSYFGCPTGLGLGFGFELEFRMRRGGIVRALRQDHENDNSNSNWWSFPTVHMEELSPRFQKGLNSASEKEKTKKKMKKVAAVVEREKATEMAIAGEKKNLELPKMNGNAGLGLFLKLNYDGVLTAWSDKGWPFSDDADALGHDVAARLAQIDLFTESSGGREASVLRYKEKRRTRLFSRKIRYQVRKVNADRRPRMKGRFVRRPNSKDE